jgi:hypothetical protein
MLQKGFAHMMIMFAVAVAAVGVAAYLLGKQSGNSIMPTVEVVNTSSPAPVASASPVSNENAEWKSYTNAKYRYTFEYPSDWVVEDTGETATSSSETISVYDPVKNEGQFFTGINISYHGMLVDTTGLEMTTRAGGTMYVQDTMHGKNYYINIPDTDQFLYITGADGNTGDEEMNKILRSIFASFEFYTPTSS